MRMEPKENAAKRMDASVGYCSPGSLRSAEKKRPTNGPLELGLRSDPSISEPNETKAEANEKEPTSFFDRLVMTMQIRVECYSGWKADEQPIRFRAGEELQSVEEVMDQWYGPDSGFFKVRTDDGSVCVLRHTMASDEWTLEARHGSDVPGAD